MDESPSSTSESAIHPCYSASCEQCGTILPFSQENLENPSTGLVPSSSSEVPIQDSAASTTTGIGITTDSDYSSDHEDSQKESQRSSSQPVHHKVTVQVGDEKIWRQFYTIGNEMIVTKPGRRLFPAMMVTLRGLDLTTPYDVSFKVTPADLFRYKFLNMKWERVSESEVNQNENRQIYLHPSSPNTGEFWMKKPVSFKSVKITHDPASKFGNILLHTMHKYIIEIVIVPKPDSTDPREIVIPIEETTFVAVSAYQNLHLTQMKIDNNPFAKGFRDRVRASAIAQPQTADFTEVQYLPYYTGEFGMQTPSLIRMIHPGAITTPMLQVPNMVDGLTPMFNPLSVLGTPRPLYPIHAYSNFIAPPPMGVNMSMRMIAESSPTSTQE